MLQSIEKALDLLEFLARTNRDISLTEIAATLGTSKPATFRLLQTLVARGYVNQHPETKHYRIGIRAWEIGEAARRRYAIREMAYARMVQLSEDAGESVFLHIYDRGDALLIEQVRSPHAPVYLLPTGMRSPAYTAAAGKVLLAFQSSAEIDRICDGPLPALTDRTITSGDELRRDLERIRLSGFATAMGEIHPDIAAISAPILGPIYQVLASLTVAPPRSRFSDGFIARCAPALKAAAFDISLAAGCPEPQLLLSSPSRVNPGK